MGESLSGSAQHEGVNYPQVDVVTNMAIETYRHCLRRSAALTA